MSTMMFTIEPPFLHIHNLNAKHRHILSYFITTTQLTLFRALVANLTHTEERQSPIQEKVQLFLDEL